MVQDALDREEQRLSKDAYQRSLRNLLERDEDDDFVWLMRHPEGRRIAARIVEYSGCRRAVFAPNASQTAYEQGKQAVGYWFIEQGERLCLHLWHKMEQEVADGRSKSNI
jgi:hypothetical protein